MSLELVNVTECSACCDVGIEQVVTATNAAAIGRRDHGVVVTFTNGQRRGDDVAGGFFVVRRQLGPHDVLAGVEGRDRVADCSGVVEEEVGEGAAFNEGREAFGECRDVGARLDEGEVDFAVDGFGLVGEQ